MHDSVEVEEAWWDGPTFEIKLGGNTDGLSEQSITIFGTAAARRVIALLRQQVEKPITVNPTEGFVELSQVDGAVD